MSNTCDAPGCAEKPKARGLCNKHYQQKYRTGSIATRVKAYDWLLANIGSTSDECVEWPFSLRENGYGQVSVNGVNQIAHRVACQSVNGPPPSDEHEAAHSCGNKACINGKHLRWATPKENAADRIIHGTHREGETAGHAKLTNQQARAIMLEKGRQRDIAARYGVTQKVVSLIKQGKTYKSALGMT